MAGLVLVHPGGGHGHPPPIEGVHRRAGEPPPLHAGGPLHPLHQGGVFRQGAQGRPGLGEPPRQLQGGPGGRQPEGAVQPPLLHPPGLREQEIQLGLEEGGPPLLPVRPGRRPAQIEAPLGQGAGLVDDGHLPVQLVGQPGGQLQPVGGQQAPVVVVEQARRRRGGGDGPVVRPQQEHHRAGPVGQAGHVAHIHPVQGHGDGAHVVLGEHQGKELGELVQLHGGVPQNLGALLQAAAEDLPELGILLRQRGLPPAVQLLGALGQPLRHPRRLQKGVEGGRLPPARLVRVLPQALQGLGYLTPQRVEPGQQGPVPLGEGQAVPSGVVRPVPRPRPGAPLQAPLEHVVLQQIHVLRRQAGEPGFQIAEHVVIAVAPRRGLQGGGDEGQNGLLQNVAHPAEEHGHPVPGEDGLDEGAAALQAAGAHGNVPEAVALLPHQAQNLRRRPLHLGVGAVGLQHGELLRLARPGVGPGGEELALQVGQGRRLGSGPAGTHLNFPGNAPLLGQPEELAGGAAGGGENPRAPLVLLQLVAGEGHGDGIGLPQQGGEHRPLLGGEVGEGVQVEVLPRRPVLPGERLRQPGQPVPGVGPLAGGHGLVGAVDEREVPQLVPLPAAALLPRGPELLRGDAAGLELVHRGQQAGEKGGLAGGALVHPQLRGHRPEGGAQQQQAAAPVQRRGG